MALVHLPRELLESLGFVTWELEMPAARFLSLGRNVESLASRTPEEILAAPDPWLLLVHPDDRERIDTELRRTTDGEQPRVFHVRPAPALAFEGELRLAAGVSESADRTTRITGLLDPVFRSIASHLEDVEATAQVRSRHELEETARTLARLTRNLSRKNQELDQFAYVASHDLKAPLRGIHSLSQWIEEDLGDRVDDQSREHLRLLRSRVQRMESLIDALLQYSRVGRGEREIETVDVARLVREVVDLLSPPAYTTVRIADLPVLEAERLPLRQVFHNLIGNAIKFNSSDEPRIEIGCRREDGDHRFWVRDNGPGIPERLQSRIWGMFQTLQSRDEIEGAGMGLALVRKIVHDRGGSVELESEEGKGSTFSFTWPEDPEPDTESSVTPYTREGQEPMVMP